MGKYDYMTDIVIKDPNSTLQQYCFDKEFVEEYKNRWNTDRPIRIYYHNNLISPQYLEDICSKYGYAGKLFWDSIPTKWKYIAVAGGVALVVMVTWLITSRR